MVFQTRSGTRNAFGRLRAIFSSSSTSFQASRLPPCRTLSKVRAVAAAEKVSVLVGNDGDGGQARSRAIRRYLRQHGIDSGVETFERGGEVAASILDKVAEIGGDLIVMGAFGSQKRSDLVLGGVTQYVLEQADIPLLMAH